MFQKNLINQFNFIEFSAQGVEQLKNAQSFFFSVFGWSYKSWGDDYADTQNSGISSGINADPENRPNHPLAVIYTDNLEAMQDKIVAAGGTITKEIFSFPGGRRFHFKDPADNELAVWSDQINLSA